MSPGPGSFDRPGVKFWLVCVSAETFLALFERFHWVLPPGLIVSGFTYWWLTLTDTGYSDPRLLFALGVSGGCPPPSPPPPPGNPLIYLTYADILAVAPEAFWSGTADCPAGDQAGDACPPSVGNALHLWVTGFDSPSGTGPVCRTLSPFWYFQSYKACLSWRQVGNITWDFDDETVDGTRVPGQNYGVVESGTGSGSAVSHVFEYSSGYNPLRDCVRPCSGEVLGPPLPGHPGGSPSFQVTVESVWTVDLLECYSTGGPLTCPAGWQNIDLRTLGAPSHDFTATSLIPIPVVEFGAAPP